MQDSVLIALIVTIGVGVTALGWKVLDIGRTAVQFGRDGRETPQD
jgi:hypothetical protein